MIGGNRDLREIIYALSCSNMRRAHPGRRWEWPGAFGISALVPACRLTAICTRSSPDATRARGSQRCQLHAWEATSIEDPDTGDGVSRALFHHEATACRNSG